MQVLKPLMISLTFYWNGWRSPNYRKSCLLYAAAAAYGAFCRADPFRVRAAVWLHAVCGCKQYTLNVRSFSGLLYVCECLCTFLQANSLESDVVGRGTRLHHANFLCSGSQRGFLGPSVGLDCLQN